VDDAAEDDDPPSDAPLDEEDEDPPSDEDEDEPSDEGVEPLGTELPDRESVR
jgi:hypothetical protein